MRRKEAVENDMWQPVRCVSNGMRIGYLFCDDLPPLRVMIH